MSYKMTKSRKMILDILKENKKPLSAEMIYDLLPKDEMNLSTVYRTLDLFLSNQIIIRSFIDNVAYYYINKTDHKHYMICLDCHSLFEIDCHVIDDELLIGKHRDFKVTHHDLTVYGYCKNCQNNL